MTRSSQSQVGESGHGRECDGCVPGGRGGNSPLAQLNGKEDDLVQQQNKLRERCIGKKPEEFRHGWIGLLSESGLTRVAIMSGSEFPLTRVEQSQFVLRQVAQ